MPGTGGLGGRLWGGLGRVAQPNSRNQLIDFAGVLRATGWILVVEGEEAIGFIQGWKFQDGRILEPNNNRLLRAKRRLTEGSDVQGHCRTIPTDSCGIGQVKAFGENDL